MIFTVQKQNLSELYNSYIFIDVWQHDDNRAVLVPHHTPEVLHCLFQGMLGNNKLIRFVETLKK